MLNFRRASVGAFAVAALALSACSSDPSTVDDTTRDDDGQITEGGDLGAFAMSLGDCVQLPTETGNDEETQVVTGFEAVPCEESHDAEVYTLFDVSLDGDYPGDEAMFTEAESGCLAQWEPSIGTIFEEDPDLDLYYLTPTSGTWDALNDREIVCMLIDINGDPLTGTRRL